MMHLIFSLPPKFQSKEEDQAVEKNRCLGSKSPLSYKGFISLAFGLTLKKLWFPFLHSTSETIDSSTAEKDVSNLSCSNRFAQWINPEMLWLKLCVWWLVLVLIIFLYRRVHRNAGGGLAFFLLPLEMQMGIFHFVPTTLHAMLLFTTIEFFVGRRPTPL